MVIKRKSDLIKCVCSIVVLFFVLSCIAPQLQAAKQKIDDSNLKVIVHLKVPGIKGLTNESSSYKAKRPDKPFDNKGRQADARLKAAIDDVVDDVIKGLKGTNFKVNRTYVSLPFIALDVDQEAYGRLYDMKEVISVSEDIAQPRNNWLERALENQENQVPGKNKTSDGDGTDGLSQIMLNNTAGIIGADDAWNDGFTGDGWYVAVIDCGVRTSHEMFSGKTIVERCYSILGDCPNGYSTMSGTGAAAQHSVGCSFYQHGTLVAGIAVGHSASLSGIAPDANLIAIQVCSETVDDCVQDYISDTTQALDYLYSVRGTYSIAAANLSLGYYAADYDITQANLVQTAVNNLKAVGIPTVAATGNDSSCSTVLFPATYSNTIAVGNSTDSDTRNSTSNYSSYQDLFAPGTSIYTASGSSNTAYIGTWSGTSLAAPHVSGAWALIKEAWPGGGVDDVLDYLQDTGTSVSVCSSYTSPRIQVDAAIDAMRSISVTSPHSYQSVERGDNVYISWTTGKAISGNVAIYAISGTTSYTIQSSYPTNTGTYTTYTWTVPNDFPLSTQTKIRIQQGSLYGDSETFSVGQLSITYPTSSQTWYHSTQHTINWSSTGVTGTVNLYLKVSSGIPDPRISKTSGNNLSTVQMPSQYTITSSVSVSNGTYTWTVPTSIPEGTYTVNVQQNSIVGTSSGFIYIRE